MLTHSTNDPTQRFLANHHEASRSNAARTLSSNIPSSNGLLKNSTAPARKACIRIFSSPCAVLKIIGNR
jgi:hypothetical protein